MTIEEEKKLVLRAQKDVQAFDALYDFYYDKILGYVFRRVLKLELAQDITAEVFIKSLQYLQKYRWRDKPFGAWLYRIASNEIQTYFRKQKYQPFSLESMMESTGFEASHFDTPIAELRMAEKILETHTDFLALQAALQELKEPYQTILHLKFFEQKKIKEIALIMAKREGTIKSLILRGVDRLRKIFDKKRVQPFEN